MNICARMRSRIFIFFCMWCVISSNILADGEEAEAAGFVVTKESRRTLVSTENGEILAARVGDGDGSSNYHLLHFFTMDPNSLFLPVLLHHDMVFYVHTGSGKLSWTEENELRTTDLQQGDVYRLKEGAVFFIQSNLETTERRKLRINAIFANSNTVSEPPTGPYSSIRDLVLGFDKKLLQAAFKVPEEEIEELFNGAKPPAIIHGVSKSQKNIETTKLIGSFLGSRSSNLFQLNKKKVKGKGSVKLFNLFNEDKDFENCNGWSTAVTKKKLSVLKDTDIGMFMVNLTTGSMMGPHWNPMASEISVVLQGRGMVHVVCSSVSNDTGCKNMRFEVEEGDVFVVPRFHPMAQMAFNNETFVFMGFSTSSKNNHPQYLAGQASVLRTLSKEVLAMSFNVRNTTMDQLLASQQDSIILDCISCAEEEFSILEEEREEAREREAERQKREEEEAREKEEEEAKRQEEERKRQKEEEAEAKREKEERKKREEEEEERKQEEEEEEAEAKREEEERKKREEEEEEERKQEEEEEEAKREEQERKRQEEEEAKAKRQEQERKRHEEEEEREREEEERKRWEEEEEEKAQREEEIEERRRQEKEAGREKEKRERREGAAERREAKEERRRQEEEMTRRKEEERERQEEAAERREAKEERRRHEEEMARREEEERQRQEAVEEKERRRQEEEHRERKEGREEKHGRKSEQENKRRKVRKENECKLLKRKT